MLNYKKVLHNNPFYRLGRIFLTDFWFNQIFFRKVVVKGRENIPRNKPVLIAPVHRNAMIDDMAVLTTRNDNPVFLARADIFKKKLLAKMFIFFRMVPVFRIRDGKESLANNEMTFDVGAHVLETDNVLIIFPEAAHTDRNQMLPVKKGAIRIAFLAAERMNFERDIYLIPTGLYYDNIYHYRHKALVIYGKPINILDYKDLYLENKQKAMLKVRQDLTRALTDLSINISSNEYYDQINESREIFDSYVAKQMGRDLRYFDQKFEVDKKIVQVLENALKKDPERFDRFAKRIDEYVGRLKQNKLKDYLFERPFSWPGLIASSILAVVFLPLYLLLWLNFAIPVCMPEILVKKFNETIFYASVRYGASLVFTLLWAIIWGIVLGVIVKWWVGVLFFLSQPLLLVVWLEYTKLIKKIRGNLRFRFNKKKYTGLQVFREELISEFAQFYVK